MKLEEAKFYIIKNICMAETKSDLIKFLDDAKKFLEINVFI